MSDAPPTTIEQGAKSRTEFPAAIASASPVLHYFAAGQRRRCVALPFRLDELIDDWQRLRKQMMRQTSPGFTRDEWAYLATFIERPRLDAVFHTAFGTRASTEPPAHSLFRPRGPVAVWLPGNVSLLGPLTLVLLTLAGNEVRLKTSVEGRDLTEEFLAFAVEHLPEGVLADYLRRKVSVVRMPRNDPRSAELSRDAAVRIMFGTDESLAAVEALPHRADSANFAFGDRLSEAWLEKNRADDDVLLTLIKVFAIYGQAGCTSPRRVVLLGGDHADARRVRDRLVELWPAVVKRDVPMHLASANVMARQWASAVGWEASLCPRHAAVVATGTFDLPEVDSTMFLGVVAGDRDEAAANLPTNIQTIGHAVTDPGDARWPRLLASTSVKRFVPLARMHHFGPVWDGWSFWQQLFEQVEIET